MRREGDWKVFELSKLRLAVGWVIEIWYFEIGISVWKFAKFRVLFRVIFFAREPA